MLKKQTLPRLKAGFAQNVCRNMHLAHVVDRHRRLDAHDLIPSQLAGTVLEPRRLCGLSTADPFIKQKLCLWPQVSSP